MLLRLSCSYRRGAVFSPHQLELINEKLSKLDLAVTWLWVRSNSEKVFYELQLNRKSTFSKCHHCETFDKCVSCKKDNVKGWYREMPIDLFGEEVTMFVCNVCAEDKDDVITRLRNEELGIEK